jgi:predicted transcriptional regulator
LKASFLSSIFSLFFFSSSSFHDLQSRVGSVGVEKEGELVLQKFNQFMGTLLQVSEEWTKSHKHPHILVKGSRLEIIF